MMMAASLETFGDGGDLKKAEVCSQGWLVFDLQRSAAEDHPQSTVDKDEGVAVVDP